MKTDRNATPDAQQSSPHQLHPLAAKHPQTASANVNTSGPRLIRIPEVVAITGLARPTIYKRLKEDPTFPRPVPLSDYQSRGAPVGFVLSEVEGWVLQRIAARGDVAA